MAQIRRQQQPPHQLEYARDLPPHAVSGGTNDAAAMLLAWAGTLVINVGLLAWLVTDLKARMQSAAGGVAGILVGLELLASLGWSSLLIVAARRFGRRARNAGESVVFYWRGKTILALAAFVLNTSVSIFDLPGDKTLGMVMWATALAGLMVTGLLGLGYRRK